MSGRLACSRRWRQWSLVKGSWFKFIFYPNLTIRQHQRRYELLRQIRFCLYHLVPCFGLSPRQRWQSLHCRRLRLLLVCLSYERRRVQPGLLLRWQSPSVIRSVSRGRSFCPLYQGVANKDQTAAGSALPPHIQ